MANQIVQEGEDSPADVFLTENSPAMSIVDNAGLFAELRRGRHASIPASTSRERRLDRVRRPLHRLDLQHRHGDRGRPAGLDPRPRGAGVEGPRSPSRRPARTSRRSSAPCSSSRARRPRAEWLDGLEGQRHRLRRQQRRAAVGQLRRGRRRRRLPLLLVPRPGQETGDNSDSSTLHFFGNQDPGAFLSVSGAGVLEPATHQDDAEQFVDVAHQHRGQQAMADSYALEYPLNPDVTLDPAVKPFDELEPPPSTCRAQRPARSIEMMTATAGFL